MPRLGACAPQGGPLAALELPATCDDANGTIANSAHVGRVAN